jgi:hypothetical protein
MWRLLARDEWWALSIRESIAAFVTSRARAIQDLMSEASDLLGQTTGSPSVQGYQGGADRAMTIAKAIYDAMGARNIRYINPPASFEGTGQKIRPRKRCSSTDGARASILRRRTQAHSSTPG